jgi:diaminopimelate epimerase
MDRIEFIKMHGCGNDFVIIGGQNNNTALTQDEIQKIANRRTGIGCDQLIIINPSKQADCKLNIYNANGLEAEACGNGSRCVASLLFQQKQSNSATIETKTRIITATKSANGSVSVNMGKPKFDWQDIPMANYAEVENIHLGYKTIANPLTVNVGNPHIVFFVENIDEINLEEIGKKFKQDKLFPEGVNVNIAQLEGDKNLALRIWERGVGETLACGTGACATAIGAIKRNLTTSDEVLVKLKGGKLRISWNKDKSITMTGDAVTSFKGSINLLGLGGQE